MSVFQKNVNDKLDDSNTRKNMAIAQRDQALINLRQAQEADDVEAVRRYRDQVNQSEFEIQKQDNEQMRLQDQAIRTALAVETQRDTATRANFSQFQSLIELGAVLDTPQLTSIANNLSLPLESVMGVYAGVQAIRDDKTLTNEEKAVKIQQEMAKLDREQRGIITQQAQNVDLYMRMTRDGAFDNMTEDEAFAIKRQLGIDDMNDPFVKAELALTQADLAYKQSATAKNLQDVLDAEAVYQELYGDSYYVPEGGKYGVIDKGDGSIGIAVKDGQSLDLEGTSRREDWCAAFVNDALGTNMGDTYEDKKGKAKETTPTAGMFFVQETSSIYGHTGIVESVDLANGTMDVVEANWKKGDDGKGIISRRTMNIADAGGFGKPKNGVAKGPDAGGGGTEGQLYTQWVQDAKGMGMNNEEAKDFAKKRVEQSYSDMTDSENKAFDSYGSMQEEEANYGDIYSSMDDAAIEDFADSIDYITKEVGEDDLAADIINEFENPLTRQAMHSELRWVEAALRRASGAAITVAEYKKYGRIYFPRQGDDAKTIAQKDKARQVKVKAAYVGMGASGQRQYTEVQGELNPKASQEEAFLDEVPVEGFLGENAKDAYLKSLDED
jgi:hypothetical protein